MAIIPSRQTGKIVYGPIANSAPKAINIAHDNILFLILKPLLNNFAKNAVHPDRLELQKRF